MANSQLPTLAAIIDASGIWAPAYDDILATLIAQYQAIYGSDAYLDADSQDGQWIALLAKAVFDANQAMVATFNAFSPAGAVGNGLSSVVKINGLTRMVPTASTVPVDIVGQFGVEIVNGVVSDRDGFYLWNLPPSVTIPYGGLITVTATCQTPGAVTAPEESINTIQNPQPGWHSVINRFTAAPGDPIESDFALRRRQAVSTAMPAQAILDAILANVLAVIGVSRAAVYENDGGGVDANGLPAHSIAVVAEGGGTVEVATAIANTKPPGSYTYGGVQEVITDPKGVENLIRYWPLQLVTLDIEIFLVPLDGWLSTYAGDIELAVAQFVSTLPIGYDSYISKLFAAAELDEPAGLTYEVTDIRQRRDEVWFAFDTPGAGFDQGYWQGPLSNQDLAIAFNEAAYATPATVSIVYQPSSFV